MIHAGKKLTALREKENMSQKQLSILSGIPRATIYNIEHDRNSPSIETYAILLDALGYKLVIREKGAVKWL